MKVVGFAGYAQSGKDTAAQILIDRYGFKRLAFADALRDSLYALNPVIPSTWAQGIRVQDIVDSIGWDRAKTEYEEIRQLLQRFGTEVGRTIYGLNFWVERVFSQMSSDGLYVITDVRFPNEERAVHDAGGKVYRISRIGVGPANTHASEDIERLFVDAVIPNNGTLEAFKQAVLDTVVVH